MKIARSKILTAGFLIILFSLLTTKFVADAKISLSQTKVTVNVRKTKTIKVKNTSEKVSWKILAGKKNISITKGEKSVKVKGKKVGRAKLQAKIGSKKLTCRITVVKKSNAAASKNPKIMVKSNKYTIVYQLNNSKAAKDLYNQLPLTLKIENYSDNEKIFYPPTKLNTNDTPISKGKKGSLAYYAPWGDVVMFYEAAGSASELYELGSVVSGGDNISKLSGNITISKKE